MRWKRELKPCPFCGSEAELRKNSENFDDQTQSMTVLWAVRCKRGCISMCAETTYKLTDKESFIVLGEDGVEKLRKRWNRRDYRDDKWADLTTILSMINDAPTVDAVEVVRCKDCKHWFPHTQCGFDEDNDEYHDYCGLLIPDDDYYAYTRKPDDYCSFGERRELDDKNTAEDKVL